MKIKSKILSSFLALSMAISSFVGVVGNTALATESPVNYNLSDIVMNGGGLPGFSPETTEYTIIVPYVYEANNFDNFPMPTVNAATTDSRADFEIDYPETETAQDGAEIKIYVNDAGSDIDVEPEKTYTLTIKTAGGNIFNDGGFETSSKTAYQSGNNGPIVWDIVEDTTGAGSKVLKANGGHDENGFNAALRTATPTYLKPGKTYLNGFMVKLDPDVAEPPSVTFRAGVMAGDDDTVTRRQQFAGDYFKLSTGDNVAKLLTLTENWEKYTAVVSSTRDADVRIGVCVGGGTFVTANNRPQAYFLYDDMYLGELVIANAEITDEESCSQRTLPLPEEETVIPLGLSVENQYGNSTGVDNADIEWNVLQIPEEGVSFDVDTKEITIADDAEAGKVVIEATITPNWTGAVQTAVKTRYTLNLEPANDEDRLPKAKDVIATGAVGTGLTLYGDYRFWSPVFAEKGAITYQWYYSATDGEPYTAIGGATGKEYTVESQYSNYFIFFEVTPVDSEGRTGIPVKSNALRQPVAPVAKNIKITGEFSVGETLTGSYEFHDDNGDEEATSSFRWLRVEEDGTLTELLTGTCTEDSGANYTVIEEDMYCHLIFEVTPKSVSEPVGETAYESKRYLSAPNSVLYGLTDIEVNGGGIKDFISSTTEYEIVLPYTYRENDPLTIARPLVTATPLNEEATVKVTYPDEIADGEEIILEVKDSEGDVRNTYTLNIKTVGQNMFPDGGFETDDISSYKDGEFNEILRTGKGNIVEDATGAGEKVFKGSGAMDSNGFYPTLFYNGTIDGRRGVYISPNKTYINGFMAKLDPESPNTEETFLPAVRAAGMDYVPADTSYKRKIFTGNYYTGEGYATAAPFKLKSDWGTYVTFFNTNSLTSEVRIGFQLSSNNKVNETYYMYDEMYLGELVITDMNIVDQNGNAEGNISVPSSKTSVYLASTLKNQYGNALGLDSASAPVTWKLITTDNSGVTFDKENKRIDITSEAEPGVVIVEATATPKYTGAAQSYFNKRYKLTINPVESSYIPKAKNITADGIVRDGQVLTADYDFYSYDSTEGESQYQWYCSTSETGVFSPISGATDTTYTVDAEHENLYICFEVIPVDAEGRRGASVRSRVLQRPTAPEALNITVSGDMIVGQIIRADYDHFDANGDSESTSTYRWLRSTTQNGTYTPISGAVTKNYRLTTDDIDCYLKFEVTPKSLVEGNSVEPSTGVPTPSRAYLAAARATVENVKISDKGGGIYTASYTYKHPHNYFEGATVCNWYLDDELIATDTKVRINSNKGTLKLEVIPVCVSKPFEGVAVTTTKTLKSGGGGGGGSGGSSGISVPKDAFEEATGIVPLPEVPESEQKPDTPVTPVTPVTPQPHWASEAVDFVLKNNIMENKAENDFAYDELVTRAEFVSYIIRGLKVAEVPYKGEFGDVTAEDSFANELQAAVEIGMISKDTNFYPDRHVSREEVCKILLFALGEENCQEEDVTAEFKALADYGSISQWAIGFVRKAMKIGMMNGIGNNIFDPRGNVTRAQTAMLVLRTSQYQPAGKEG